MKYVLALMLLTAAAPVHAQVDICKSTGDLAEVIMLNRQQGVAMSALMAVNDSQANSALKELITALIKAAYSVPQMSLEANRRDMAARFRNDAEAGCYSKF